MNNKYERHYGCSRNQYRRIKQGAKYNASLDGSIIEFEERKRRILGE